MLVLASALISIHWAFYPKKENVWRQFWLVCCLPEEHSETAKKFYSNSQWLRDSYRSDPQIKLLVKWNMPLWHVYEHILEAVSCNGTTLNLEAVWCGDAPLVNIMLIVHLGLDVNFWSFYTASKLGTDITVNVGFIHFPLKRSVRCCSLSLWIRPYTANPACLSLLPLPPFVPSFHTSCLLNWKRTLKLLFLHSFGVVYQGDLSSTLCLTFCWENIPLPKSFPLHITANTANEHNADLETYYQTWCSGILALKEINFFNTQLFNEQHYFPKFCNILTC